MGKPTKFAPRINLAAGLLWLLSVARDLWMPGFLSIAGKRHSSGADLGLSLLVSSLLLFTACRGFMRMRAHSAR